MRKNLHLLPVETPEALELASDRVKPAVEEEEPVVVVVVVVVVAAAALLRILTTKS